MAVKAYMTSAKKSGQREGRGRWIDKVREGVCVMDEGDGQASTLLPELLTDASIHVGVEDTQDVLERGRLEEGRHLSRLVNSKSLHEIGKGMRGGEGLETGRGNENTSVHHVSLATICITTATVGNWYPAESNKMVDRPERLDAGVAEWRISNDDKEMCTHSSTPQRKPRKRSAPAHKSPAPREYDVHLLHNGVVAGRRNADRVLQLPAMS
jgi:hypothetical protein